MISDHQNVTSQPGAVFGWAQHADRCELEVACSGSTHTLQWDKGRIVLADHPDLDAELALVAFGGEEPSCLEFLRLFQAAVADGGFLGEWVDDELDHSRLWWLTMALERMRAEGFHEFLRELPVARANQMGQFLVRFPDRWRDVAAAQVAANLFDGGGIECAQAPRLLRIAVAKRLRTAFVHSIAGRRVALGAAALVPFEPIIAEGLMPSVDGLLRGRSSWCRATTEPRWLADVWGAGAAVIGGDLVLALDHETAEATIVSWVEADATDLAPILRQVPVGFHADDGWVVQM